jgi:hypothetical protein
VDILLGETGMDITNPGTGTAVVTPFNLIQRSGLVITAAWPPSCPTRRPVLTRKFVQDAMAWPTVSAHIPPTARLYTHLDSSKTAACSHFTMLLTMTDITPVLACPFPTLVTIITMTTMVILRHIIITIIIIIKVIITILKGTGAQLLQCHQIDLGILLSLLASRTSACTTSTMKGRTTDPTVDISSLISVA